VRRRARRAKRLERVVENMKAREERVSATVAHYDEGARLTGITIGKGAMMCRIYDKVKQLKTQPDDIRDSEYATWREEGWDGEKPVVRVEFQVRGVALQEFGMRDLDQIFDSETGEVLENVTLADRIDGLWQACIRWCRIVVPEKTRSGKPKPAYRLKNDPCWEILKTVTFEGNENAKPLKRTRIRGTCPTSQPLGCAISTLVARGRVRRGFDIDAIRRLPAKRAEDFLRSLVASVYGMIGEETFDDLLEKRGSAQDALEHVAENVNARIARWWATGPPPWPGPGDLDPTGGPDLAKTEDSALSDSSAVA
jgi:hypothetical protein